MDLSHDQKKENKEEKNTFSVRLYIENEKSLLLSQTGLEKTFGLSTVFIGSTPMESGGTPESTDPAMLIKETIHILSCGYEENTDWGKELGWIYGSVIEDIFIGFKMQCKGWRSIYCMYLKPSFKRNTGTIQNIARAKKQAGDVELNWKDYKRMKFTHCMGTGVIFYEEITEDLVRTWDLFDSLFAERLRIRVYPTQLPFRYPLQSFLFDPDRPYDMSISAICPNGGILHPSPPRHPPVPPPFGPSSSQYIFGPDYTEVPMIPPRSYYSPVRDPLVELGSVRLEPRSPPSTPDDTGIVGEPYDPLHDLADFIDEYYRHPLEADPAPIEEDPVEDPVDTNDEEDELADTDTGEDEDPEEVGQSEDSEDTRSDGHSVVSTDTRESRA